MSRLLKQREGVLENGKVFTIAPGVSVILYPLGTLAFELGRSPITIRKWELSGVVPKAPFRSPTNDRLYTKEHIALLKRLHQQEDISTGHAFRKTSFTRRANEGFKKLQDFSLLEQTPHKEVTDAG